MIADGPRRDRPEDAKKCAATRAIIDRVDWECEVLKKYSDVNLGVGHGPASGLRWVFENVEEAIVLEDDCVPHPTFFRYCDELLETYRHDGFFSCYCFSCGWATWRRAFQYYDPELNLWPALRDISWLLDILGDPGAVEFWKNKFDLIRATGIEINGWDWPWLFANFAQRGLSILPSANLISNIGFGEDATHTTCKEDKRANLPMAEMTFPLKHPLFMARDPEVDQRIGEQVGLPRGRPQTLYYKLRRDCVDALPASLRKSLSSLRSIVLSNVLTRD